MEPSSLKELRQLICPACGQNITDKRFRAKCILIPGSLTCPYCSSKLRLAGNHWFGMIVGGALMVIGGRLLVTALPALFSVIFFLAGVVTAIWGFYTSALTVEGERGDRAR